AGLLATESYDFPPQVRASATFRRTCSRISLAWAGYLFLASTVRLLVLRLGSVDLYVVMNVLSGLPVSAALLSWSIWYGARSLGRDAPGPGHCGALPPEDGTRSATGVSRDFWPSRVISSTSSTSTPIISGRALGAP